jgi:hypothetical protein
MNRIASIPMVLVLLSLSVLGCGEDGGRNEIVIRPEITQTFPPDGSSDIKLNPWVRVWFDQALDEATIDSASFHVVGAHTYRVEYDQADYAIGLLLRELLEPDSTYQVVVKSSISTTHGKPMLSDFTFSFTTGPKDCDHLEDYLEPNNDIASAAQIELEKTYPLLSSCGGEQSDDCYKFTLSDTTRITARIERAYSDVDQVPWYIQFRRQDNQYYSSIIAYISPTFSINHRHSFLPGTYYLWTGNGGSEGLIGGYNLRLQASAPCYDDAYEDNDFLDQAPFIGQGVIEGLRGCSQDNDYFAIHLGHGTNLTVAVTEVPPFGSQREIELLARDGSVLSGGTHFDDPAVESWTADRDTTVYIRVMWWDDNREYDLDVDVFITPTP